MLQGSEGSPREEGAAVPCPSCRASRLVEITLNVGEDAVTMRSCSKCDRRWWVRNGELVPVSGILELASTRR